MEKIVTKCSLTLPVDKHQRAIWSLSAIKCGSRLHHIFSPNVQMDYSEMTPIREVINTSKERDLFSGVIFQLFERSYPSE